MERWRRRRIRYGDDADADFVTIRAEHFRGREAIAGGHAGIFRTVFAGSIIRYMLETARLLAPERASGTARRPTRGARFCKEQRIELKD